MRPVGLIEGLTAWAKEEPRVRALILTGSRARSDHQPDRWSDTDFSVYADDHEALLQDLGWLDRFGDRWLTVIWEDEIMTMIEGGLMVGIHIRTASDIEPGRRAFVALWDPEGLATKAEPEPPSLPSAQELADCVSHFWLQVVFVARRLGRGDLYMAADRFGLIRHFVLEMLEWHARAAGATDTWYDGRYMSEWAEPWAVDAMANLAPEQHRATLRAALRKAIEVFERLTTETAARLGLPRPTSVAVADVESVVAAWVDPEALSSLGGP